MPTLSSRLESQRAYDVRLPTQARLTKIPAQELETLKALDRLLRIWRTKIALGAMPARSTAVLDIGCGEDGYLLNRLNVGKRDGLDPLLTSESSGPRQHLAKGRFPQDIEKAGMTGPYDAIFALAVFEHLDENSLSAVRDVIPELLREGGRLIITVPHPFVDRILDVLMFLKLIDGQATEEHHGYDPNRLLDLTSEKLRLVLRKRFQLGLNNLFVFERTTA